MALIKCPECGKEVSDKCTQCIHCGYPLVNYKCVINGEEYDFQEEISIILDPREDGIRAIGSARRKTFMSLYDAKTLIDIMRQTKKVPPTFTPELGLDQSLIEKYQKGPGVSCPYCHSTNTRKISGASKAGSVAMFGVLGIGKTSKQWHCNNCNSDF